MEKQWQVVRLKDDAWIDLDRKGHPRGDLSVGFVFNSYNGATERYEEYEVKNIDRVPSGVEVGLEVVGGYGRGSRIIFIPNENIINIEGLRYGE